MKYSESEISAIVKQVVAKLNLTDGDFGSLGIFEDMNDAIAAAKEAQKTVRNMSLDAREKVIAWASKKPAWATSDIRY